MGKDSSGDSGRVVPPHAPGAVLNPTPGETPLPSPLPSTRNAGERSNSGPSALERIISPQVGLVTQSNSSTPDKTGSESSHAAGTGGQCVSRLAKEGVVVQTAGSGKPPRLIVYEIEGKRLHEHHLRPAKRQEKLTRMLKDLFKRHDEGDAANGQSQGARIDRRAEQHPGSPESSRVSSRASSRASSPIASPSPSSAHGGGAIHGSSGGAGGHHHINNLLGGIERGLGSNSSGAGAGDSLNGSVLRHTDSEELDRDAADAVTLAMQGGKPPSLLSGLAQQLRSKDANHYDILNEMMSQRNYSSDPTLVERYGHLSSVVGKGSFGVVRLAQKPDPQNKRRKLVYAVKEFHPNSQEPHEKYMKRLASEFCLASSLHHPNVIQTLDLLNNGRTKFCGVMEYCAGGDLYSLIVVAGKLEPTEMDCFFKQIMRGISYMHGMGVAHRDLKPENVLLTSRGCCKLTDFGNAECFRMAWETDVHLSTSLAGSGPYIAPEEYKKQAFDPRAVDVWAAGVIYMAMATGRHLWHEAKQDDEFFVKYLTGRKDEHGYEPIERLRTPKRRNVIYSVLDPVASRRLTASQVLNSEWGREICVCEAGEGELPH